MVTLGYMVVVTSGFGVVRWKVLCRRDGGVSVGLVVWTITKIRFFFFPFRFPTVAKDKVKNAANWVFSIHGRIGVLLGT